MSGRKRKPTKLHLVHGTYQLCRHNKKEPNAPPEAPRAAIELSPRTSFWYGVICGRLQGLGIASNVDSEQVMLLAERLTEIEECDTDIKEHGRTYVKIELIKMPDGKMRAQKIIKSNPAVVQKSSAMRHAQSLLAEFGLSPASRGKVSRIEPGNTDQNGWATLL